LVEHGVKFSKITNLTELNQWAIIEAQKRDLITDILYLRYRAAKIIGKKTYHSSSIPVEVPKEVENKKLHTKLLSMRLWTINKFFKN
jgi:hypothetical protein